MGKVSVTVRVLPDSEGTDLGGLFERINDMIPEGVQMRGHQMVDVAFGLRALLFNVLVNDSEGGIEALNERIEKIEGVGSVEVTDLSLI